MTVVAPIEMPFVVKADPISNNASVKETPIVVKTIVKMTRVKMRSVMAVKADVRSTLFASSSGSSAPFPRANPLRVSLIYLAEVISLDMRIPPAIENAQPPIIISVIKMANTVLFCPGMLM